MRYLITVDKCWQIALGITIATVAASVPDIVIYLKSGLITEGFWAIKSVCIPIFIMGMIVLLATWRQTQPSKFFHPQYGKLTTIVLLTILALVMIVSINVYANTYISEENTRKILQTGIGY